jgi:hypothetical protein
MLVDIFLAEYMLYIIFKINKIQEIFLTNISCICYIAYRIFYILRLFGGRQPLCGIGVLSIIV